MSIKARLKEADNLYQNERYKEALQIYNSIEEVDVNEFQKQKNHILFYIGACLTYLGNYSEAIQQFQKILDFVKEEAPEQYLEICDYMGFCYKSLEKYTEAINVFKNGEPYLYLWNSGDELVRKQWYNLAIGDSLLMNDEYDLSISYYNKAIELIDLTSVNIELSNGVYLRLFQTFILKKDYFEADKTISKIEFKKLVQEDKNEFISWLLLLRHFQGLYKQSISDFNQYVRNSDNINSPIILLRIGISHFFVNDLNKSEEYFKECIKIDCDNKSFRNDAFYYLNKIKNKKFEKSVLLINIIGCLGIYLVVFNFTFVKDDINMLDNFSISLLLIALVYSYYLRKKGFNWYFWFLDMSMYKRICLCTLYFIPFMILIILMINS